MSPPPVAADDTDVKIRRAFAKLRSGGKANIAGPMPRAPRLRSEQVEEELLPPQEETPPQGFLPTQPGAAQDDPTLEADVQAEIALNRRLTQGGIRGLRGAPGATEPPTSTVLSPAEEADFQGWYQDIAKSVRPPLDPNPDNPLHQYDYRAAYAAGAEPDAWGHWPSEFKRAGHPNLIVDGVDTRTGEPAQGRGKMISPTSAQAPLTRGEIRRGIAKPSAAPAPAAAGGLPQPRRATVPRGPVPRTPTTSVLEDVPSQQPPIPQRGPTLAARQTTVLPGEQPGDETMEFVTQHAADIAEATQRGFGNLMTMIGGTGRWIEYIGGTFSLKADTPRAAAKRRRWEENRGLPPGSYTAIHEKLSVGRQAQEFGEQVAAGHPAPDALTQSIVENPSLLADPRWWTTHGPDAAVTSLPFFAAGGFIGPLGAVISESALEAGAVWADLKNKGASDEQAAVGAAATFAVNVPLTKIPADEIFGAQGRGFLRKVIGGAGAESFQETFQQITSNLATGEPVAAGVAESQVLGAAMGAGMGAGQAALERAFPRREPEPAAEPVPEEVRQEALRRVAEEVRGLKQQAGARPAGPPAPPAAAGPVPPVTPLQPPPTTTPPAAKPPTPPPAAAPEAAQDVEIEEIGDVPDERREDALRALFDAGLEFRVEDGKLLVPQGTEGKVRAAVAAFQERRRVERKPGELAQRTEGIAPEVAEALDGVWDERGATSIDILRQTVGEDGAAELLSRGLIQRDQEEPDRLRPSPFFKRWIAKTVGQQAAAPAPEKVVPEKPVSGTQKPAAAPKRFELEVAPELTGRAAEIIEGIEGATVEEGGAKVVLPSQEAWKQATNRMIDLAEEGPAPAAAEEAKPVAAPEPTEAEGGEEGSAEQRWARSLRYAKKFKNKFKREYAKKYAGWVMMGRKGDSPEKGGNLTEMAAQAVRMNIDGIFEDKPVIDEILSPDLEYKRDYYEWLKAGQPGSAPVPRLGRLDEKRFPLIRKDAADQLHDEDPDFFGRTSEEGDMVRVELPNGRTELGNVTEVGRETVTVDIENALHEVPFSAIRLRAPSRPSSPVPTAARPTAKAPKLERDTVLPVEKKPEAKKPEAKPTEAAADTEKIYEGDRVRRVADGKEGDVEDVVVMRPVWPPGAAVSRHIHVKWDDGSETAERGKDLAKITKEAPAAAPAEKPKVTVRAGKVIPYRLPGGGVGYRTEPVEEVTEEAPAAAAPAEAAKPGGIASLSAEKQEELSKLLGDVKDFWRKQATGEKPGVGVPVEILGKLTRIGALLVEAGAREFAAWSQRMLEALGEQVKPYLAVVWDRVKTKRPDLAAVMEGGEDARADEPGAPDRGALEGAPAEDVRGAEGEGDLAEGGVRGPRADERGPEAGAVERPEPGPGEGAGEGGVGVPPKRGRRPKAGVQPRKPATAEPAEPETRPFAADYRITDKDDLGAGGAKTKADQNIAAIKLLKHIEGEGRPATPEEQAALVKYVGWGGIPQPFSRYPPHGWERTAEELKELLTEEEWASAEGSTVNAHYTSRPVIQQMWSALKRLGVGANTTVLEPAVGVGHFFGLMPEGILEGSRRLGVELDSITGRIARTLYPDSAIHVMGFQDTALPDNFFDVAVSNVPFGDYGVHDPHFKRTPRVLKSIHDYFFAKALEKIRPGGIIAFITSRYTMDSVDSGVRRYIAERADLIGAIRLPNTAFKGTAGTEVTTDIIFLQKRAPQTEPKGEQWQKLGDAPGTDIPVNEYFVKHPEMMLGKMERSGTMYRGGEPALIGEFDENALAAAVKKLPKNAYTAATLQDAAGEGLLQQYESPAPGDVKPGAYFLKDGTVYVKAARGAGAAAASIGAGAAKRIKAMLPVRDALREVFRTQLEDSTDEEVAAAREKLGKVYDAFVRKHGYLWDRANMRAFDGDPDSHLLLSLENWDRKTKKATKTEIFTRRTIERYRPVVSTETAMEALAVSLNELGRIDWPRMENLTGRSTKEMVEELGDLVFRDPEGGGWSTADEYLSGNVRKKLVAAEAAAKIDPTFKRNAEALEKVLPKDLDAGDISATLGSSWIPEEDIADFVAETLDLPRNQVAIRYEPIIAAWTIRLSGYRTDTFANTDTWGTVRTDEHGEQRGFRGSELIQDALNFRETTSYRKIEVPDGQGGTTEKRVVDPEETTAARNVQSRLRDEFVRWLWSDDQRAARLLRKYNDEMNNIRLPEHDGSHLTLPGSNPAITLKTHQKNAIWRIIRSGNTLLGHPVGAGKTFEMAAAAMELRRMGLAKKPMIVVPNHLVGQWQKEFLKLYPAANLLVAGKEHFVKGKRQRIMSRIATGNYDAVIVAHKSFEALPLSTKTFQAFMQRQLDELEDAIIAAAAAEGKRGPTVKELVKAKKRLMEKIAKRLKREAKDITITFEEMGVDTVLVDEAHAFKNLFFVTKQGRVAGVASKESDRAFDMYVKTQYISEMNNGRGVVFATGTPVSNTMAEMFTMQRFLQAKLLRERGIDHFDSWASLFGRAVQKFEISPTGAGFRTKTRFAEFVNIPELAQMFRLMADIKTAEELGLPTPILKGGKPTVVAVPGSEWLKKFITQLGKRAEKLKTGKVDPHDDNMLKITGDGRKAALDPRLVGGPQVPDTKAKVAAEKLHEIWEATKADKLTQLVFLDLGTPSDEGQFNVYDDLKNILISKGVPESEIRYIHQADTDAQKIRLFDQVNDGDVRILIGSSEKMGVGMNVQKRLIALHHIDAPWRPADVEQREGRILRQGNENPEVEIFRYVTQGSFDSYMWQGIARKARFINQAMTGDVSVRRVEDIGGTELTAAEAMALSTGNPKIMEKVETDAEVRRLDQLQAHHIKTQAGLAKQVRELPQTIQIAKEEAEKLKADIARRDKAKTKEFEATVEGKTYQGKEGLIAAADAMLAVLKTFRGQPVVQQVGTYKGFDIYVKGYSNEGYTPDVFLQGEVRHQPNQHGFGSMSYVIEQIDTRLKRVQENIVKDEKRLAQAKAQIGAPFEHAAELKALVEKQVELNASLDLDKDDAQAATQDTEGGEEEEAGGGAEEGFAAEARGEAAEGAEEPEEEGPEEGPGAKDKEGRLWDIAEAIEAATARVGAPPRIFTPDGDLTASFTPDKAPQSYRWLLELQRITVPRVFEGHNYAKQLESLRAAAPEPKPEGAPEPKPEGGGILNEQEQARVDELSKEISDSFKDLAKGERAEMGLPLDILEKAARIGAIYVKAGAREFSVWSARMVGEFGEAIREHLETIWDYIRRNDEDAALEMKRERTIGSQKPPDVIGPEIRKELKTAFGTKEERYKSQLGAARGQRAFNMEIRHQARQEMGESDVSAKVGKVMTVPEVWEFLNKVPYLGAARASKLAEKLTRLPWFGKQMGVRQEEMDDLVDAVESIKELDENGQPVFGTTLYEKDEETGEPVDVGWRYTPAQGQAFWDRLTPQAKSAAQWWVTEREMLKETFEIGGNIEGYIHHLFENGLTGGFRRIYFRKVRASQRMHRTEAEGYIKDFRKAVTKNLVDLNHEKLFNDFIVEFAAEVTDPISEESPLKEGWREIPRFSATRTGRKVGQIAGGRQIPAGLYDDFVRYVEAGKEVSEVKESARALARFYKANLILAPSTFATNALSGGMQYTTGVIDNIFKGIVTGDARRVASYLVAPYLGMTPTAVAKLPAHLWGARANVLADIGLGAAKQGKSPIATTSRALSKALSIPLSLYQAIENYWKRVIFIAEARSRGLALDADTLFNNLEEYGELRKAIDKWAYDYQNIPRGLEKWRASATGSFLLPFPTYGYKLSRMIGHYVAGLNFTQWKKMGFKDVFVRLATLGTIMFLVHLASDDDKDEVGPHVDGMPWSVDKTARIRVGSEKDEEAYLRVIKYPWFNFYQLVNQSGKAMAGSTTFDPTALVNEFLSEGPLLQGWMIARDEANRWDQYRPKSVRIADAVKPFIPGFRISEGVRTLKGGELTYPKSFTEAMGRAMPVPGSWVGMPEGNEVRVDRATKLPVIINPTVEQLKFWFGINIKTISATTYNEVKTKMLDRAERDMQNAETTDEFDKAAARLKKLDPARFGTAAGRNDKRRILVPDWVDKAIRQAAEEDETMKRVRELLRQRQQPEKKEERK